MYKVNRGVARRKRRATQKRIWLARVLCLGAGVSFSFVGSLSYADGPTSKPDASPEVRSNPFVLPSSDAATEAGSPSGTILRTSDLQFSELRLKTIGTAVGLVPIGNPRPAQTILEISKPSESRIHVNPLANESKRELDRPVIGLPEIESIRMNAPVIVETPVAVSETVEIEETTGVPRPLSTTGAIQVETQTRVDPPMSSVPVASVPVANVPVANLPVTCEPIADEPILFSMTDLDEPLIEEAAAEAAEEAVDPSIEMNETEIQSKAFLIPPPSNVRTAERSPTSFEDEADDEESSVLPLLPTPSRSWVAAKSPKTSDVQDNSFVRYPERRRAHVEVATAPMISYQTETGADADASKVSTPAVVVKAPIVPATPIVPAKFAGFRSANAATQSASRSGRSTSGSRQGVRSDSGSSDSGDSLLQQIRKTFPSSRITLAETKGRLVVRGVCADREEATEIIRLIRSKHLIPVDDKMQIR